MRLSIYHFPNLPRSYAVLQFEGEEVGKVVKALAGLGGASEAGELISKALSCRVRSVSLASGELIYRGMPLKMVYLRFELEDDREYVLEVYEESAMINSNTDAMEALRDIKALMKTVYPSLRERGPTMLAF